MFVTHTQMSISTTCNDNIFCKTQGSRLGAIIAPNRDLVLVLAIFEPLVDAVNFCYKI